MPFPSGTFGSSTLGLLVVLSISALLCSGVLRAGELLASLRMRSSSRALCSFVEAVQLSALKHERPLELAGFGPSISALSAQGVVHSLRLLSPFSLKYRRPLRFYPSGAVTPATMLVSNAGAACVIKLSLYGRCSWRC